ncbi:MAG: lamin tail domain-containing protein [Chloroflexota bacterium]
MLLLLLLTLLGGMAAVAAAEYQVYLPLIIRPVPQPTATQTPTQTPTHTATTPPPATATQTATPTVTLSPAIVKITYIEYNPAGDDLPGEYVSIENQGGSPIDLTGWTLSDADAHVYTFPAFTLQAGAAVKVWSRVGTNTGTDLYWGSSQAIWTNTGDCATLQNGSLVVDHVCY